MADDSNNDVDVTSGLNDTETEGGARSDDAHSDDTSDAGDGTESADGK